MVIRDHFDRTRPHAGQPHTFHSERGRAELIGLTMRDVMDAFVIGWWQASGLFGQERYTALDRTVYDLPDVDPMAVAQNALCELEWRLGTYPNVTGIEVADNDIEERRAILAGELPAWLTDDRSAR